MLSLQTLLDIVCTEALEHGGVQEVPDNKHGALQNYHALKRDARHHPTYVSAAHTQDLSPIQYDLHLVIDQEGALVWEE